jgi:hypothetical protein
MARRSVNLTRRHLLSAKPQVPPAQAQALARAPSRRMR